MSRRWLVVGRVAPMREFTPERLSPPTEAARFARNTFWLGVAQVARVAAGAVVLITVPNLLPDVADYGRLGYALTLCSIFAMIADFGLSEITVRDVAAGHPLAGAYINGILGLKLVLGAGVYGLIVLWCVVAGQPADTNSIVLLMGGFTVLNSFCVTLNHQFRGLEQTSREASAVAMQNVLIAACVVSAAYFARDAIHVAGGYLAAAALGCIATGLFYRAKVGSIRPLFARSLWRHLIGRSSYFVLANVVMLVYLQIDVVMLWWLSSETQVGLYRVASQVISAAVAPVFVVLGAMVPQLSRLHATERDRFNGIVMRLERILLALIMPLAAVACIFSGEVVAFLFKPEYAPAGNMLRLLAVGLLVRHIVPYRTVLSVTGHQAVVFKISLAAAVLNIALNAFLIPIAGGMGAAVATVVTCGAVTVAMCVIAWRRLALQVLTPPVAVIVVAAAVLADGSRRVLLLGLNLWLPWVIIAFGAGYGVVMYLAALSPEDRRHAWRSVRGGRSTAPEPTPTVPSEPEPEAPQPISATLRAKRKREKANRKKRKRRH